MPYVRRRIDQEKIIPNWLRKLFGFAAAPPPERPQVRMPEAVKIPPSQPRSEIVIHNHF